MEIDQHEIKRVQIIHVRHFLRTRIMHNQQAHRPTTFVYTFHDCGLVTLAEALARTRPHHPFYRGNDSTLRKRRHAALPWRDRGFAVPSRPPPRPNRPQAMILSPYDNSTQDVVECGRLMGGQHTDSPANEERLSAGPLRCRDIKDLSLVTWVLSRWL